MKKLNKSKVLATITIKKRQWPRCQCCAVNQTLPNVKKHELALRGHKCTCALFGGYMDLFKDLIESFPIWKIPLLLSSDLPEFIMQMLLERLKNQGGAGNANNQGAPNE